MLNTMSYFQLLFLSLTILFLNACQSTDSKNKTTEKSLFINYEVRYLEQEKEMRALAYFKEGDTLTNAKPKAFSNVSFQNSAMDQQNLGERGFRYALNRKGPYSANLDFGYHNDEGMPVKYDLSMPEVGTFSIKEGQIQKSKGATIAWSGEPLDASQSLVFMFTDQNNKAYSISIKGPTKSSEFFIIPNDLSKLTNGEGQLYLVKKQVKRSKEQNRSILSVVEFYTSTIDIKTVE